MAVWCVLGEGVFACTSKVPALQTLKLKVQGKALVLDDATRFLPRISQLLELARISQLRPPK
eukprot:2689108-Rhodomonas_salina.1